MNTQKFVKYDFHPIFYVSIRGGIHTPNDFEKKDSSSDNNLNIGTAVNPNYILSTQLWFMNFQALVISIGL